MTISERIDKAIKDSGMSFREVASKIGVSKSAIQRYAAGNTEKIPVDCVAGIAKCTGVSAVDLLGWNTDEAHFLNTIEYLHIAKYRGCDDRGKEMVDNVLDYEYSRTQKLNTAKAPKLDNIDIPIYATPAAAGSGTFIDCEDFEVLTLPAHTVPIGADFGLRISGNSMAPTVNDGDIVFVRSGPCIESGDIGIFALDGQGYCKRLHVDGENQKIALLSDNADYDPIIIKPEQTLYTFGKVLI